MGPFLVLGVFGSIPCSTQVCLRLARRELRSLHRNLNRLPCAFLVVRNSFLAHHIFHHMPFTNSPIFFIRYGLEKQFIYFSLNLLAEIRRILTEIHFSCLNNARFLLSPRKSWQKQCLGPLGLGKITLPCFKEICANKGQK